MATVIMATVIRATVIGATVIRAEKRASQGGGRFDEIETSTGFKVKDCNSSRG